MRGLRTIRAIVVIALMAVPCFAGEVAVLKNGFSIRHERREVVGDVTRLYVNADGSSFVDVPTAEIEHFEAADDPASGSRLAATATKSVFPAVAGASAIHSKVDITEVVNEASGRYRLDPDLVKALAAYNAGPHRVEQFGGVPPYYETRAYVARIVRDFNKKKAAQDKAVAASKKRTPAKNASANSSVPTSKHASKSTVQAKASTPGQ